MGRKREGQPKEVQNTPAGKFGQHLEELMAKAGIEPNELAEAVGVTPGAVRFYLRGVSVPEFAKWPAIAKALKLKNVRELVPSIAIR